MQKNKHFEKIKGTWGKNQAYGMFKKQKEDRHRNERKNKKHYKKKIGKGNRYEKEGNVLREKRKGVRERAQNPRRNKTRT